jgi:hypothetical protein
MGYNIGGSTLLSTSFEPAGTIIQNTFRKVTLDMIDTVNINSLGSITASGNDSNGMYYVTYSHPADGCVSSGFAVKIKSSIPWNYLVCKFYLTGGSACWNFNTDGYSPSSGMLSYDVSAGDQIFAPTNTFENATFVKKSSACDNEPNNFFHQSFNSASFKQFSMFSRRNGTLSAGPTHGRACGTGGITTISEIYIF